MEHGSHHVFFLYLGCLENRPRVPITFEFYIYHRTWAQVYDIWIFLVNFDCMVEGDQTANHPQQMLYRLFFILITISCGFSLV